MQTYFFIRTSKQYVKINYHQLIYIESVGNYVKIVADGGTYLAQLTIKQLEKILPMESFCRVNRGCIVSMDRITAFDKDSLSLPNIRLPFTERYRKELERKVNIIVNERQLKPHSIYLRTVEESMN
jgi:two-component system LytT family response regulator